MASLAQIVGVLSLAVGGWLLWSPWAFVAAGGVLTLAPEFASLVRR